MAILNKIKGCLYGSVVGDVLGAPYEFLEPQKVLDTYLDGGLLDLPLGAFTDDTSLSLCIAEDLLKNDLVINRNTLIQSFVDWYYKGYLSCTNNCFDIGNQTRQSLEYWVSEGSFIPENKDSSGNGSLMRVAPLFVIKDIDDFYISLRASTIITHNNRRIFYISEWFCKIVHQVIYNDLSKDKVIEEFNLVFETHKCNSPSGFILDSVYVALYSFINTTNFKDSIIKACEFGYDTDTNACITGIISGAYYGYDSIPEDWLTGIYNKQIIDNIYNPLLDLIK